MASRVLTIAAVLVGVGTGTAFALLQRPKAPLSPKLEARPLASSAPAARRGRELEPPSETQLPVAGTAPEVQRAPFPPTPSGAQHDSSDVAPYDVSEPTDAAAVKAAEMACGGADIARECVRAAAAYASGRVVPKSDRKVGILNHRAHALFDLACRRREAEGCYALAWLHANGRGVKQSGELAEKFFVRALELCRERSQPICERLGVKPP